MCSFFVVMLPFCFLHVLAGEKKNLTCIIVLMNRGNRCWNILWKHVEKCRKLLMGYILAAWRGIWYFCWAFSARQKWYH